MSQTYKQILSQAIDLLDGLSTNDYQATVNNEFTSSIGTHIRHVVDHFMAIVDGYESAYIDYNKRNRFNQIELSPESAKEAIKFIINWIESLDEDDGNLVVNVKSDLKPLNSADVTCQSSLDRELIFVTSHAIHHYALIRSICQNLNAKTPEFFGYSPETVRSLKDSA